MYLLEAHYIGCNTYLAEWVEGLVREVGPTDRKRAHDYVVKAIMRGEKVAMAVNDYEMPIFQLLINLGWP